ncbi:hypothetical protein BD410DRAFT_785160 [Rickenella mellea]|uniref:DUF6533 domain-containing protein n=1 Tax=Rickenella mellea TaxID=50990 RepID=A0A4Y7QCG4_9AGAM|nr:hypothetical protein BD410DRAFT_785160 [Rickenella mellea]
MSNFHEMDSLPHEVLEPFIQRRFVNYITTATLVLAIWDYFVLLPEEVALIWPSRWTLSKCLFLLNRYSVFVDPIMLLYVLMVGNNEHSCSITGQIAGYICVIGFKICQLILILRTYAVWGCKLNKPLTILLFLYLCLTGLDFWAGHKYIAGLEAIIIPGAPGCALVATNRWVWWPIMQLMIIESALIILLAYKALQHFRIGRTSLITVMYYDGLLYYICIQVTLIANLVVVLVTTVALKSFLIDLQRVFHSVLCARILLHIRRVHKTDVLQSDETLPTMALATNQRSFYLDDMGTTDIQFYRSEGTTIVS